jgi:[protein-PII] uridylyltransferase
MYMETSTSIAVPGKRRPSVPRTALAPHFDGNPKATEQIAKAHRMRLYEMMVISEPTIRSEEMELHFVGMPLRYWPRVNGATLQWHLDIVHEFIDGLTRSDVLLAPPVVRWRHVPDRGFSEVIVCTWDRLGLLAKIAGAFAAVGLNIVRADIYTRADNVVLDVFQVCDEELRDVRDASRLKQMEQLLTVALSPNGGGEAALRTWMRYADEPATAGFSVAPVVVLDNEQSKDYTVLEVQAFDRVGLLHNILEAVSSCNVDIAHAVIVTEQGEAADVFFLTDTNGLRIRDAKRLEQIRQAVLAALG